MNLDLLKKLVSIPGTSGDEKNISDFILEYVETHSPEWTVSPQIIHGKGFQDAIILVFGNPTTAVFAHMDTIGYTVGYDNMLIKVGGPKVEEGIRLRGEDSHGAFETELLLFEDGEERSIKAILDRDIDRGTPLSYIPDWREDEESVQCCYMDNRLGVWNALKLAETLENGAIVFSTYEEHGGGSVGFLGRYLFEKHNVTQALISDITWATDGISHGKGVAISMRDSGIPRRVFLNRIIDIADDSGIDYQLEVESAGGSDGIALQRSDAPFDWVFIGAAESNVHSPDEKVSKYDIQCMLELYKVLMERL